MTTMPGPPTNSTTFDLDEVGATRTLSLVTSTLLVVLIAVLAFAGGAIVVKNTNGTNTSAVAVVGTVTSLTGTTMTVKNLGGKTVTVELPAGTHIITVTTATGTTPLAKGKTVSVTGTTAADGIVTASTVTLQAT
jgi:hypothetical protein